MVEGLSSVIQARSESCLSGPCPLRAVAEKVTEETTLQDAGLIAQENGLVESTLISDPLIKFVVDSSVAVQYECRFKSDSQNAVCGSAMFFDRSYFKGE